MFITYNKFNKKTILAKGTYLEHGSAINSHYHLYLNEDEVLKFAHQLHNVKLNGGYVYEILSETKKPGKTIRLVLQSNEWGGRSTGVPRASKGVIVLEDPITPKQLNMLSNEQKEWTEGFEIFCISVKDDVLDFSRKITSY